MVCCRLYSYYVHVVDHSRVVLTVPDGWGSDYINASYINVRPTLDSEQTVSQVHYATFIFIPQGEHGDTYIASQGVFIR